MNPSVSRKRIGVYSFFFQAEDGIRDLTVTGVQTCALPISVADELKGLYPERVVNFLIGSDPYLVTEGDARLLRIVLENLLHNAWKFTAKRPQIGRASCRERV